MSMSRVGNDVAFALNWMRMINLFQSRLPRLHDSLRPVGNLQLAKNV